MSDTLKGRLEPHRAYMEAYMDMVGEPVGKSKQDRDMENAWRALCVKAKDSVVTKTESDPYGKPANGLGSKLDAGKSPIFQGLVDYFPRACIAVANVSQGGAVKYAWKGWETVPDGYARYSNALGRHLLAESIEGDYDSGPTGLSPDTLHAAQVAWNAMARLELKLREIEKK